jgi:hypothetical protein
MDQINKVIVVFKTHLDVGYTDMAENVLKKYRDSFIPQAVTTAFRENTETKKRFVWTVGSFLIHHYLSSPDVSKEDKEKLEKALKLGYTRWHGLACTTHSELMNPALLGFNLSLSQELDDRYNKKTIAAKMTDVPGHTIAMVPYLARGGVEYLHIGVNSASRMPEVPALFIWRYGETEIVVNYSGTYGEPAVLPAYDENGEKLKVCLEFAPSHDNAAPPSEQDIDDLFKGLAEKYPGAEISAGSLDDFALAVRKIKNRLPVVEEEIGDTWIHGAASDPLKTAQYKKLLRLNALWTIRGLLPGDTCKTVMENLLMVAEHTWGTDSKRYLQDYSNWKKEDFRKARARNSISEEYLSSYNTLVLSSFGKTVEIFRLENKASYSNFEASHKEQRDYIEKAVAALPEKLAAEARSELEKTGHGFPGGPTAAAAKGKRAEPFVPLDINGWTVAAGAGGNIIHLKNPALKLDREVSFCLFSYEVFDGSAVDRSVFNYARGMKNNWTWFDPSFGKPGLRFEEGIKAGLYTADSSLLSVEENALYIIPKMPGFLCEEYGCPREIVIEHRFGDKRIDSIVYLSKKDANRIPEAIWLGMNLNVSDSNLWEMVKIGNIVSPFKIVRGGNRHLHCVEELRYCGADLSVKLIPEESPLVSLGPPSLYDTTDIPGSLDEGFNFNLYNNRWGTNFKQWFEDDLRLLFTADFS